MPLRLLLLLFCATVINYVYAEEADGETLRNGTEEVSSTEAQDSLLSCANYIPYRHPMTNVCPPDSADLAIKTHKSFWRASAETVGTNLGLWAFDRFVLKGHYSYISWNTIKENFKHGFEWDNDFLKTNMFDHPYNGSIFFNAGRSNGFNFWQSELFAIGGSGMWEMFMECEYPSTNDIIATPVGGAAIGEVLYRTSDLVLDDRATGVERFGREFAAFLIDPMRGINRIVTGQAWKRRATSGRRFGLPPLSLELSIGYRFLKHWENDSGTCWGASAELNMEYGERFSESHHQPYDFFALLLEVQAIKTQPLLSRVEIVGRLLSKNLIEKDNFALNLGLYQHFDFFDSDTISPIRDSAFSPAVVPYKFGTPASVGGGLMFRYVPPTRNMTFDGSFHANAVVLAGILSEFYKDYNRNYNWGSGFSLKATLNWGLINDKFSIKLADQHYRTYTWQGYEDVFFQNGNVTEYPVDIQGDSSHSWFNHFEFSGYWQFHPGFYLTGGLDFYSRNTVYHDITIYDETLSVIYSKPLFSSKQLGAHLMFTYKF